MVYTGVMKNITLSAPEDLLRQARHYASCDNTSLNTLFREWLEGYEKKQEAKERALLLKDFHESVEEFSFTSDRKYTREEMHER